MSGLISGTLRVYMDGVQLALEHDAVFLALFLDEQFVGSVTDKQ